MTKLDEIETKLADTPGMAFTLSKMDVLLLIRAVKQLDEFRRWIIEHPGAPIAPEHLIFPDVLDLLDNDRS